MSEPAASTATPVAAPEAAAEAKSDEKKEAAPAEAASKDEKKEEKKEKPAPEVKKMHAVLTTAYGEPDKVIDFGEIAQPSISKPEQVLIKVHSASINPIDYKINRGYLSVVLKKTFPYAAGFDVSGEVVAVGGAVKKFAVGDKVFGDVGAIQGTFAEYVVAPHNTIAKIPSTLGYTQAAAVPLAGLTAYQSLVSYGKATEKSQILVLGGSGGTGSWAVQIGKAIGAHVIATASTRNFDLVRGLGADRVIDYSKEKWYDVLKNEKVKVDVVFDTVGEVNSWENGKHLLNKHGIFTQIARKEGAYTAGFFASVLGRKIASWFGEPHYKYFLTDITHATEQLEILTKWIEAGKIKPVIETVLPFSKEGGLALFKSSEEGKARGKVVLEVIKPDTPTQPNVEAIIAAAPPLPAPAPAAAAAPAAEAPAAAAASAAAPAAEAPAAASS